MFYYKGRNPFTDVSSRNEFNVHHAPIIGPLRRVEQPESPQAECFLQVLQFPHEP